MKKLKRGILISIEGIDGSGKSTLAKNLLQKLVHNNYPTIITREPGGTTLGKQLRQIVQKKIVAISDKAEFLLFAADRAQHFQDLVLPHLEKNYIVISDRMADSSLAYQGYGRGLCIKTLQQINTWVMNETNPDITFYLKISLETSINRLKQRNENLTSFERENTIFTQKLINGFESIFEKKNHVYTFDGTLDQEELTEKTYQKIINYYKSL